METIRAVAVATVPLEVMQTIRERAERLKAHLHLAGGAYEHEAEKIIQAVNEAVRSPQ